jgi:hypothetical protein
MLIGFEYDIEKCSLPPRHRMKHHLASDMKYPSTWGLNIKVHKWRTYVIKRLICVTEEVSADE